jgi:hypothetical protein
VYHHAAQVLGLPDVTGTDLAEVAGGLLNLPAR